MFIPQTLQTFPQDVHWFWPVADPSRGPLEQTGSWAYSLLPFLEQQSVHRDWRNWETAVPALICPARRHPHPLPAADDEFARYISGGWSWTRSDYAVNPKLIRDSRHLARIAHIRDGASQTVFGGEKAMLPALAASGSWHFDEPIYLGNSNGCTRHSVQVVRDANDVTLIENWGSPHHAGAHFVFADGSVRILHFGVPAKTMTALLTPSDGDIPSEF